ncbi:MAG: acyl carrier protein [Planctomycetes bacterium]|nr:acyl carrier protein [Planctomycetota bacterium]
MSDNADVKEKIRSYILQEFLPGEDASNLKDDTPLTSSGILDSVSTLKLVRYVEDTYDLIVEAHEASSDFDKLEDIVAMIARKAK